MTRQEHHLRQVKWYETLSQYGKAEIEPSIKIRNAEIFPDVYAEIDDKKYIIEIGDVDDKRKEALLSIYAENHRDLVFIHEHYGEDKINEVLKTINAYRSSDEGKLKIAQDQIAKHNSTYSMNGLFFGLVLWFINILVEVMIWGHAGDFLGAGAFFVFMGAIGGFMIYPILGAKIGSKITKYCHCKECEKARENLSHAQGYRATTNEDQKKNELDRELEQDSYEDSEGDGLMSEGDLFFPEEPEPEDEDS